MLWKYKPEDRTQRKGAGLHKVHMFIY